MRKHEQIVPITGTFNTHHIMFKANFVYTAALRLNTYSVAKELDFKYVILNSVKSALEGLDNYVG